MLRPMLTSRIPHFLFTSTVQSPHSSTLTLDIPASLSLVSFPIACSLITLVMHNSASALLPCLADSPGHVQSASLSLLWILSHASGYSLLFTIKTLPDCGVAMLAVSLLNSSHTKPFLNRPKLKKKKSSISHRSMYSHTKRERHKPTI